MKNNGKPNRSFLQQIRRLREGNSRRQLERGAVSPGIHRRRQVSPLLSHLPCRTIVKEHIPKRHLDFENPISGTKTFDNTSDRIYGERNPQPMISESYYLGKSKNPADNLTKVGRKTQNQEREVSVTVIQI